MPKNKILKMVNDIDDLECSSKERRSKPKLFDYINRSIILLFFILLCSVVYKLYLEKKENVLKRNIIELPTPLNTISSEKNKILST